MREPTHPPFEDAAGPGGLQLFLGPDRDGAAAPAKSDQRLTEAGLSALVDRIQAVSVYVKEVESDAQERERMLEELHARMYARIVEVEEMVRAAEARAREERARAELAEERVRTLEEWLIRITEAMSSVERSGSS